MFSVFRSNLAKVRDRFLFPVNKKMDILRDGLEGRLDVELGAINARIEALRQGQTQIIRNEQEPILHKINDLSNQFANSGTVVLSEAEMITKLFNGHKICLDPRDIGVALHIALDSIWEPPITKAWLSLLKPEQTVFDIGANFGYFGMLAAKQKNKNDPKVYFFEANPNLIPYINKTLSINWLHEESVVENLAISDKKSTLKLSILKDYISSSSLHSLERLDSYVHEKMHVEANETVKVKATTVDDYCAEHSISKIDIIKMDIEGYEEKAYKGMREIVKKSPDITMFLEFTPDGYDQPEKFYKQMLLDFGNLYLADIAGNLIKQKDTSYKSVTEGPDDLVMMIFSKRDKLEREVH